MDETCSAYGGEKRCTQGFWWGNLGECENLDDQGVDVGIILRWIFRKWDVGTMTGSIWLKIGTGRGHLGMR